MCSDLPGACRPASATCGKRPARSGNAARRVVFPWSRHVSGSVTAGGPPAVMLRLAWLPGKRTQLRHLCRLPARRRRTHVCAAPRGLCCDSPRCTEASGPPILVIRSGTGRSASSGRCSLRSASSSPTPDSRSSRACSRPGTGAAGTRSSPRSSWRSPPWRRAPRWPGCSSSSGTRPGPAPAGVARLPRSHSSLVRLPTRGPALTVLWRCEEDGLSPKSDT